jgi:hypothetical protein
LHRRDAVERAERAAVRLFDSAVFVDCIRSDADEDARIHVQSPGHATLAA